MPVLGVNVAVDVAFWILAIAMAAAAGQRRSLPNGASGCMGARVSMIPNRNRTITAPM